MVSSRNYRHRKTTGQMQAMSRDVSHFHPIFDLRLSEDTYTYLTKNKNKTMEHPLIYEYYHRAQLA